MITGIGSAMAMLNMTSGWSVRFRFERTRGFLYGESNLLTIGRDRSDYRYEFHHRSCSFLPLVTKVRSLDEGPRILRYIIPANSELLMY